MRLDKQDQKSLVLWATDCAEHVLPYFEENYPKDDRPRKPIEAGRAWVRGEIAMSEARAAAFAATTTPATPIELRPAPPPARLVMPQQPPTLPLTLRALPTTP
jgi:immunity protein 5 of polymorphic toxin system